jgi:hypothetical protein
MPSNGFMANSRFSLFLAAESVNANHIRSPPRRLNDRRVDNATVEHKYSNVSFIHRVKNARGAFDFRGTRRKRLLHRSHLFRMDAQFRPEPELTCSTSPGQDDGLVGHFKGYAIDRGR